MVEFSESPKHIPDTKETEEGVSQLHVHNETRDQRIGREIAFGIQQTLACWATDFIDPYVGKWFQNKYGNQEHKVTGAHTWGGEIFGDSAAFFAYMFVKRVFTAPMDALTTRVKNLFDSTYTKMGNKALKPWMKQAHIDPDSAEYKQKLEDYKKFQAENLVDTGIIATAATSINVVAQRQLFGNRQGYGLILASKLIGASATMATMLGLRTALPTTMKSLDDELSQRFFSKVVYGVKKLFGVKEISEAKAETQTPNPLLPPDKERQLIRMVASHAALMRAGSTQPSWLAVEQRVLDAMIEVFDPQGAFAQFFADQHRQMEMRLYRGEEAVTDGVASENASRQSIQSILSNRISDLSKLKLRLSAPEVGAQIAMLLKQPEDMNVDETLSAKKRTSLVDTLLQQKIHQRGEVAAHILAHAKGQILEHQALAFCFDPNGLVSKRFGEELVQRLPEQDEQTVRNIARNYMADRQRAALRTAKLFDLQGDIVQEAVHRSAALQQRFQPPATDAVQMH